MQGSGNEENESSDDSEEDDCNDSAGKLDWY
jgi:hypothetical protein